MRDDDLMLIGSLDQPLPTDNDEILNKVEQIIQEAI